MTLKSLLVGILCSICLLLVENDAALLPWLGWSDCSVSCGPGGRQERRRLCSPPNTCALPLQESKPCIFSPCPFWGAWTIWSSCAPPCGRGIRRRRRPCLNGGLCQPLTGDMEMEFCEETACRANWNSWEPWGGCTEQCGTGKRQRMRTCSGPIAGSTCFPPTANQEMQNCNIQPCQWTGWSMWSDCSQSCSGGLRMRTRNCQDGDNCIGLPVASQVCNPGICPNWLSWTAWGPCSRPCGGGGRVRMRFCNVGLNRCEGDRAEMEECNMDKCIIWEPWDPWGFCSVTCGIGRQMRQRTCPGSNTCPGLSSQPRPCIPAPKPCPLRSIFDNLIPPNGQQPNFSNIFSQLVNFFTSALQSPLGGIFQSLFGGLPGLGGGGLLGGGAPPINLGQFIPQIPSVVGNLPPVLKDQVLQLPPATRTTMLRDAFARALERVGK